MIFAEFSARQTASVQNHIIRDKDTRREGDHRYGSNETTKKRIRGILEGVPTFTKLWRSSCDDWMDRVIYAYTVFMLILFALDVTAHQLVGNPINCINPFENFKTNDWYKKYLEYYCWSFNTYGMPWGDVTPVAVEEIKYYQWMPLILAFQAFLFKVPNLIWKLLNRVFGIKLNKVVIKITHLQSPVHRGHTIRHLDLHQGIWVDNERTYIYGRLVWSRDTLVRYCRFICSRRTGKDFTVLFLITKGLVIGNVIGQFFLLDAFLATNYMYGFEVIDSLIKNEPWKENPQFPRAISCQFQIRQLDNIQEGTTQCDLYINFINEKIFLVLWFWFFFVVILTCFNLFSWIYIIALKRNIKKYLVINC